MDAKLRPEDIRAYANRDWAAIERMKRAHRAAVRDADASQPWRAGQALFAYVRRVRRIPLDHTADLAHHVKLKRRIERASRALSRP